MFYQIVISTKCNLSCRYCMQKNKKYYELSYEDIDSIINLILKNYINNKNNNSAIIINISGGEPFLCFDKVKYIINNLNIIFNKENICLPQYEISTNLTILNDDIINFLIDNNIFLYIGYDGIHASYNRNRISLNKNIDIYMIVESNLSKIEKLIKNGLNIVIAPNNINYLIENINYIINMHPFSKISINIAYNTKWKVNDLYQFEKMFNKLCSLYLEIIKFNNAFSIKIIDDQVIRTIKNNDNKCSACFETIGFSPNLNIYCCGNFIATKAKLKDVVIGHVYTGIDKQMVSKIKNNIFENKNKACNKCEFNNSCNNYCLFDSFQSSGSPYVVSATLCEINKIIIKAVDNFILKLYNSDPKLFKIKYLDMFFL